MSDPAENRLFFREHGYLLLKGALSKSQVNPIREHVLGELKRLKVWSGGKSLSGLLKDVPAFQQVTRLGQMIKYSGLQDRVVPAALVSAIKALTDTPLVCAQDAQLLLSLPNQGEWRLDGLNWHVDVGSPRPDRLPGVQAFVLVDDLAAQGGATLAIAGSHRVNGTGSPQRQQLHALLKTDGKTLAAGLAAQGLGILEMTGRAGDVYLMDMRLLHSPSINASRQVRIMATARYLAA